MISHSDVWTEEEPDKKYLTIEELQVIYDLLKFQYISYENIEAQKLIRKINGLLVGQTRKSTQ